MDRDTMLSRLDAGAATARRMSYDEARAFCQRWNEAHDPGFLSRKCEFTEE